MANPVCDVLLTQERLAPREMVDLGCGAAVDFQGIVRASEGRRQIEGIIYEAYETMAEHQLRLIAEHAAGKFSLGWVVVHHRLGFVPAGEMSLLVRVGSPHRAAAFQASEWIVNELKKKVPIWKQPRFRSEPDLRKGHGVAGASSPEARLLRK